MPIAVDNFYTCSQKLLDNPKNYQKFVDHVRHVETEAHERIELLVEKYEAGNLSADSVKTKFLTIMRAFAVLSGVKPIDHKWKTMSVSEVADECHTSLYLITSDTVWCARQALAGCPVPNGNPSDQWMDRVIAVVALTESHRGHGFAAVDYSMCW